MDCENRKIWKEAFWLIILPHNNIFQHEQRKTTTEVTKMSNFLVKFAVSYSDFLV
jgi:hypothetical protein